MLKKIFKNADPKKMDAIQDNLLILFIIAGALFAYFTSVTVEFNPEKTRLELSAWITKTTIVPIEEIDNVELLDSWKIGSRESGVSSIRVKAGVHENSEYGEYMLYIWRGTVNYVKITMGEEVVVFNCKTEEETIAMYDELCRLTGLGDYAEEVVDGEETGEAIGEEVSDETENAAA